MPRDPVKNRANTARTRQRLKTYQEWKAHILAQWSEHNTFHVTKQEDGGFRIHLEQTPIEGERVTREIAEFCNLDPDTVIQKMVGECLAEMGGVWKPASKEQQEMAKLRAENAEIMRRAGL